MNLSIIIPSRNRPDYLKNCLASLLDQLTEADEVIVVENNKKASYKTLIKQIQALKKNLTIRLLNQPIKGKSLTRNLGLIAARNELIAFLDDDCLVPSCWVRKVKQIFQNKQTDFVLGFSKEKNECLLLEAYQFQYKAFFLKKRINFKTGQVKLGSALNTRNCIIKKSFLDKHQIKFDPRFDKFGFGEDTDFGAQLTKKGGHGIYSPKIEVIHHESKDFLTLLKKRFINGRAIYHVKKKGNYQEIKVKGLQAAVVWKKVLSLIREGRFCQRLLHFIYLNLVIWVYKFGYCYELIYDRFFKKNRKKNY